MAQNGGLQLKKQIRKSVKRQPKQAWRLLIFRFNEKHIDLVRRNLSGDLTDEEFNKEVMKLVNAKGGTK
ncbi:hypothetical protein [Bacillus sp. m3-13]|uniref:hypothetical protein n=1 Tax=Bacillus sp. m3-13 TaxID=406124 RepID=UPI0001E89FD5|nr:hypothetical protein [Bacillus sp. m3-13]